MKVLSTSWLAILVVTVLNMSLASAFSSKPSLSQLSSVSQKAKLAAGPLEAYGDAYGGLGGGNWGSSSRAYGGYSPYYRNEYGNNYMMDQRNGLSEGGSRLFRPTSAYGRGSRSDGSLVYGNGYGSGYGSNYYNNYYNNNGRSSYNNGMYGSGGRYGDSYNGYNYNNNNGMTYGNNMYYGGGGANMYNNRYGNNYNSNGMMYGNNMYNNRYGNNMNDRYNYGGNNNYNGNNGGSYYDNMYNRYGYTGNSRGGYGGGYGGGYNNGPYQQQRYNGYNYNNNNMWTNNYYNGRVFNGGNNYDYYYEPTSDRYGYGRFSRNGYGRNGIYDRGYGSQVDWWNQRIMSMSPDAQRMREEKVQRTYANMKDGESKLFNRRVAIDMER